MSFAQDRNRACAGFHCRQPCGNYLIVLPKRFCSRKKTQLMYVNPSATGDGALARSTRLFLHTRGICGAEQVAVRAAGGTVILCGKLPSGQDKWRCLECCRHVAGVIRVIDQIQISAATKGPVE